MKELTDQEKKDLDSIMKFFEKSDCTKKTGGLGWIALSKFEYTKHLMPSQKDFYLQQLLSDGFLNKTFSAVNGVDFYGKTPLYATIKHQHGSLLAYYDFLYKKDKTESKTLENAAKVSSIGTLILKVLSFFK